MTRWADFVIRKPLSVGVVSVLLVAVLVGFSFQFRVETDMFELMGDNVEFVRDSKYITERLGGLYSYEILVELPEEDMAKQPDVLKTIDMIAAHAEEWEETTLTLSLTDILKDLNMTMHNNDDTYYRIPDDQELIAQYLLLYEMSGGENAEDWVDYEYKKLRLSVQLSQANMNFADKFEGLAHYTQEFPEGTEFSIVGDIPILMKMIKLLSYGQIKSVLAALVVITFIMMLILKSPRVGLISMIPNIFPIIAITGVMGLLDYPLDMITVMIAPMIIGIAVDDTVHYIVHFKQEFEQCGSYFEANRHTFGKVGTAIVFTSVILTIGFAIFGLSIVQSMMHLAVLSGVGIVSALAADLFITPVLFVFLRPFGTETQRKDDVVNMVNECESPTVN
jgi:predicted RND superfamily exporter protein